ESMAWPRRGVFSAMALGVASSGAWAWGGAKSWAESGPAMAAGGGGDGRLMRGGAFGGGGHGGRRMIDHTEPDGRGQGVAQMQGALALPDGPATRTPPAFAGLFYFLFAPRTQHAAQLLDGLSLERLGRAHGTATLPRDLFI